MSTTIVVGSGSSGGVIAARLSEQPDHHVILIEAGPDYPDPATVPASLRDPDAFDLFGHDWGFTAHAINPTGERAPFPYLRGRVIGGSSAVATAALRPTAGDFAAWSAVGGDQWSWPAVLPYFRKLENDIDFGSSAIHGDNGPVTITRAAPTEWPRMMHAFEAAALERGYPKCPDANAIGATGVGPTPRNMTASVRASSLTAYIQAARGRPNLEIRANCHVDQVLFDGHTTTGVSARKDGSSTAEEILGDRVILAAGFMKSPQILMLSGIGPREQLHRLGIQELVDLPVGETLYDHPEFALVGVSTDPAPELWGPRVQLTFSSGSHTLNDCWVRTALLPPMPMFPLPPAARAAVWLSGVVGKPLSVGRLALSSKHPDTQPELYFNYFDHAEDRRRAREMIRMLHRMATEKPFEEEVSEILSPGAEIVNDDEQLDAWLRQSGGSAYHGCGTCPLGQTGDGSSVVNEDLAVHGTEGLYVADASVMPEIPTNATNLACFMIGERMADIVRAGH